MITAVATKRVCACGCGVPLSRYNHDDYTHACRDRLNLKDESAVYAEADSPYTVRYTKEQIVEAIKGFHEEHGRAPTSNDMRYPLPARTTCAARFGSWRKALAAAGLKPIRGGPNDNRPPTNDGPRKRVRESLSMRPMTVPELAKDTGMTYRSVEGVVRRMQKNGTVERRLRDRTGYDYTGSRVEWSLVVKP